MTTIAFDGKTMAADTRVSGEYIIDGSYTKVHRIVRGKGVKKKTYLVGAAGELQCVQEFLDWLSGKQKTKPEGFGDEFQAMVYCIEDKILQGYENRLVPYTIKAPYSIGSGSSHAMGALLAGADAKRAVEISALLDPATGGEVNSLSAAKTR